MVKEGRERGNGESEGVMTISIGGRLQEDVGKDSWRRGRTKGGRGGQKRREREARHQKQLGDRQGWVTGSSGS